MKFWTVLVLPKAYQNTDQEVFRNCTLGVTMASLLKQWGNLDLHETRQIMYHLKGNDDSFPKMHLLLKSSDWSKSYGHLSGIFGLF